MKVKVFGKRELLESITIFRYAPNMYEAIIHTKIKNPEYHIDHALLPNSLKFGIFHFIVEGPTINDDILISLIPENEEEIDIISGFEEVKLEKYILYILFVSESPNEDRIFYKSYNDR